MNSEETKFLKVKFRISDVVLLLVCLKYMPKEVISAKKVCAVICFGSSYRLTGLKVVEDELLVGHYELLVLIADPSSEGSGE